MVIGIVANNGILLLDADEKYRADGMDSRTAMEQAAKQADGRVIGILR